MLIFFFLVKLGYLLHNVFLRSVCFGSLQNPSDYLKTNCVPSNYYLLSRLQSAYKNIIMVCS